MVGIIRYESNFVCSKEKLIKCTQKANKKYCIGNEDKFQCEIREKCKDVADKGADAKKQCISEFCKDPENENKFECLALFCKYNYKDMERFYCTKIACTAHQDHKTCKRLVSCEESNPGMNSVGFVGAMAKLSFAKCIMESKLNQAEF